jgi:hypothetical protein
MRRLVPALALLAACSEYDLGLSPTTLGVPMECDLPDIFADQLQPITTCAQVPGSFTPIVEWGAGQGMQSRSVPAVADLDGDGRPEVVANFTGGFLPGTVGGEIHVLDGATGTLVWKQAAGLGYASGLTVGDVDRDGHPEIFGVKALGNQSPMENAPYAVVCYDWQGNLKWTSDTYHRDDFDYASGISLSDMDHDGDPELVVGRAILDAKTGAGRGVGQHGRGSFGIMPNIFGGTVSEGSVSAVADVDMDGVEEVVTGNAVYAIDGTVEWYDGSQADGFVAIANLDGDDFPERVVSSFDTVRAVDHDGTVLWGPRQLENANIVSPAAVADVNGDGVPEIYVAGGNQLVALHADGGTMWSAPVIDESGASGPAVFDFETDGVLDVVYIDEQNMTVFDGMTGAVKFFNPDHASDTMMDYPVIADVDADGQAEIVVAHAGSTRALSVYGDQDQSWGPARRLWNQHAYAINHIDDAQAIPVEAEPSWLTHNTWHSATDTRYLSGTLKELSGELIDTCDVDCEDGTFWVIGRVRNHAETEITEPIPVALYAVRAGVPALVDTVLTTGTTPASSTGTPFAFALDVSRIAGAEALRLVVDDDGTGLGVHFECDETDNGVELPGPFCQP